MAESEWSELGGKEVRFGDETWRLTGTVDVRDSGETLAVEATETTDVRRERGRLFFDLVDGPRSLNPGNLGAHFDRLEPSGGSVQLLVDKGDRTHRYRLERLTYD
jgi:hypothetical protein